METAAAGGNAKQDVRTEEDIVKPIAVVGVEGIYDLRKLRDKYRECAIYQEFIEAAFGSSEELWDRVSPARAGYGGVQQRWKGGKLVVLAHSKGDELVDVSQAKAMAEALEQWRRGALEQVRRVVFLEDLEESHDGVWEKGVELAQVISRTIGELKGMEFDGS